MRYYIPGILPAVAEDLAGKMANTAGTLAFQGTYRGLLSDDGAAGILFEVVKTPTAWQLIRAQYLTLHFVHASPATGTRVAVLDLQVLQTDTPCHAFLFCLVWAPDRLELSVGRGDGQGRVQTALGERASFTLQVVADDRVFHIGDAGITVMGARAYADGKPVLRPTAWNTWQETLKAVDALMRGVSPDGYLFEVVAANAALAFLVTGFETYCQARFHEMQDEGWEPDKEALVKAFLRHKDRDQFERHAKRAGWSFTRALIEGKHIDFQNYDRTKRAFNRAYDIKFGELVSSGILADLQQFIGFRHIIIHVSPLLGLLNAPHVPPDAPVFAGPPTVQAARGTLESFIGALHQSTLVPPGRQRPPSL